MNIAGMSSSSVALQQQAQAGNGGQASGGDSAKREPLGVAVAVEGIKGSEALAQRLVDILA